MLYNERYVWMKCLSGHVSIVCSFSTFFLYSSKIEPHLNLSEKTKETAEIEKQQIKQLLIFFDFTYKDIPEVSQVQWIKYPQIPVGKSTYL